MSPLRLVRLEARTISDHDLSVSHSGAGFGCGFSRATPPVSRKRHTASSIEPLQHEQTHASSRLKLEGVGAVAHLPNMTDRRCLDRYNQAKSFTNITATEFSDRLLTFSHSLSTEDASGESEGEE